MVWTETWPSRNWIWSSSPPASRHRRGSGGGHAGPAYQWLLFWRGPSRRATQPAPLHHLPKSCPRANAPKHATFTQSCGCKPRVNGAFDPVRNGRRPNMPGLANQIDDRPVVIPALKMSNLQFCRLLPAQPATQKEPEQCSVPLAFQRVRVWRAARALSLGR